MAPVSRSLKGIPVVHWIGSLIAALWIVLPAVQYVGAYHRAGLLQNPDSANEQLALLDLTPWYLALLFATALFLVARFLLRTKPTIRSKPP